MIYSQLERTGVFRHRYEHFTNTFRILRDGIVVQGRDDVFDEDLDSVYTIFSRSWRQIGSSFLLDVSLAWRKLFE